MKNSRTRIETRLQFSPNQTVILGQVAFDAETTGPSRSEDPKDGDKAKRVGEASKGMLLFITRGKIEE